VASDHDRIITLEAQVRKALATVAMLQGQPSNATFSVPHNDSFPFEDNVDGTHPANLRYIISGNVTRVVTAKLSIFMAPYRTYNTFSATTTGGQSNNHNHGHNHGSHLHSITFAAGTVGASLLVLAGALFGNNSPGSFNSDGTTPAADVTGANVDHTHLISVASTQGVTEGTTATGVTISFDGVDQTANLLPAGPYNADVFELDVRRFLGITTGVKHTIAMKPSGNGRIEAFLRLGVYVSAGTGGA
jgi:hypothetical protein